MALSLLYAIDSSFEDLACVSLASFLVHNRFHSVYCITPQHFPEKFRSICLQANVALEVLHIPSNHPIYQLPDSVSPYFYCVAGFDLLSNVENNVLYVDADTLCTETIDELSSFIFADQIYLAACSHGRPMIDRQLALGLQSPYHYFNAGVFLFNPSRLPASTTPASLVHYYQRNTSLCRFREQCSLNAQFRHNVAFLPSNYNYLSWMRPRLSDHVWHNPLHNPFSTNLEYIRATLKIAHFSAKALPLSIPTSMYELIDFYWHDIFTSLKCGLSVLSLPTFKSYSPNPSNL